MLLAACGKTPPAEESCNFIMNRFNRRVSWAETPIRFYADSSINDNMYRDIIEAMEIWNRQFDRPVFEMIGRTNALPGIRLDTKGETVPDGYNGIYVVSPEIFNNTEDHDEQARTSISYRGDYIYEADILIDASESFFYGSSYGYSLVDISRKVSFLSLMVHELGHAFGLWHIVLSDAEDYIMGSGRKLYAHEARWLAMSHYFNDTYDFNSSPKIVRFNSVEALENEIIRFSFDLSDSDGLYQAYAFGDLNLAVVGWDFLSGKNDLAVFDIPRELVSSDDVIWLQVMDLDGNWHWNNYNYVLPEKLVKNEHVNGLYHDFEDPAAKSDWETFKGNWNISDGSYKVEYDGSRVHHTLTGNESWRNYVVEVDMKVDRHFWSGVIFRAKTEMEYYVYYLNTSRNKVQLFKHIPDTYESRNDLDLIIPSGVVIKNGVNYNLKVEVNDSNFKFYINDVLQHEFSDSSYQSGRAGLWSWQTNATFDNFRVTTTSSDIEADDEEKSDTENQTTKSNMDDKTDINGDGKTDILDLVLVASRYGETITGDIFPNPDVNRDGIVDIQDIILVTQQMPKIAGAPSFVQNKSQYLQYVDWDKAYRSLPKDVVDKAFNTLDLLFSIKAPSKTVLLSNYPNPFNPETWIPYKLAELSEVGITIRSVDGQIVRKFQLGYQLAGNYVSPSRAVYWDGKNNIGEPVSSGIYFYTLRAGDFSYTRRMFILK